MRGRRWPDIGWDVADRRHLPTEAGEIPTDPGVYRFRDAHGGSSTSARPSRCAPRLSSYFQDITALHPRTATMVTTAASVEWTVVRTEVEGSSSSTPGSRSSTRASTSSTATTSLPLPRRHDGRGVPRAQVMRGAKRKGTRYFGPYGHAWAIRETLDLCCGSSRAHCSRRVQQAAGASGRPCLLGYIDKCSAPASAGSRPTSTAPSRGLLRLHGRNTTRFASARDRRRRRRPSSTSSRPPACATTSGP